MGCRSMAGRESLKLATGVRFPSPQPIFAAVVELVRRLVANEEIAGAEPAGRSIHL